MVTIVEDKKISFLNHALHVHTIYVLCTKSDYYIYLYEDFFQNANHLTIVNYQHFFFHNMHLNKFFTKNK
jgi:hypothetical protein